VRSKPSTTSFIFAGLAVAACWGGGSGRVSSFDSETVVGDLGEDDFRKLCSEIDRWSEGQFGSAEFKREQCEIDAALVIRSTREGQAQLLAPECRQAARSCEEATRGMSNLTLRCARGPERCAKTIEDLERCLTDRAYNLYGVFLTAPMCDDICRTFDPFTLDAASCAEFAAACPGYLFTSRPSFPLLEAGVPNNCRPVL
jgi:hypothetical protein